MGGPVRIMNLEGKWVVIEGTDNFYNAPMMMEDSKEWPTVEHYFQAFKFSGDPSAKEHMESIRLAPNALDAWQLGQSRKYKILPDWEDVKFEVMLRAVRAKYKQYPDLQQYLINAGDGEVMAGPSTASWQMSNSKIISKVREELVTALAESNKN